MQFVGIEGDVFHAVAIEATGNLFVAAEVALEHQLAAARDQDRMDIGAGRCEPIGHLAKRRAVDELVLASSGHRPVILPPNVNTAAVGRLCVDWQCVFWNDGGTTEKRNKFAPSHCDDSLCNCG